MGYTLYLEGSALAMPEPVAAPAPMLPVTAPAAPVRPAAPPPAVRKAPLEMAAAPMAVAAVTPAPAPRPSSLRMPDRLQIALLRASACNPNDPETRAMMERWPLAELRASPAAKRALWPQLRALRRKSRS
ncbi:MAG: alanine acetyltransferase [Stenotrophomonas sp.]